MIWTVVMILVGLAVWLGMWFVWFLLFVVLLLFVCMQPHIQWTFVFKCEEKEKDHWVLMGGKVHIVQILGHSYVYTEKRRERRPLVELLKWTMDAREIEKEEFDRLLKFTGV